MAHETINNQRTTDLIDTWDPPQLQMKMLRTKHKKSDKGFAKHLNNYYDYQFCLKPNYSALQKNSFFNRLWSKWGLFKLK